MSSMTFACVLLYISKDTCKEKESDVVNYMIYYVDIYSIRDILVPLMNIFYSNTAICYVNFCYKKNETTIIFVK